MENELFTKEKHGHLKIKIAVSGTADTSFLDDWALEACKEVGKEVVKQGAILISGATTGVPIWAARGAKEAGGISVGLSPAASEREHVELYKLPLEYMDFIVYTGFGFVGRDMLMTRTADAIIIGPGRIGTIHEFTVAFEDRKPIGIMKGPWDTDEVVMNIIEKSHRKLDNTKIVFEENPKILVEKLIAMAEASKVEKFRIYRNPDTRDKTNPKGTDQYEIKL